jgi:diamine N-acetyltransferase
MFDEQSAHRAFLEVYAHNTRARKLYERFGFTYEGTYRDGARNPRTGRYEDLCIYGLLDNEYKQQMMHE